MTVGELPRTHGAKPAAWWLSVTASTPAEPLLTSTRTRIVTPRSLRNAQCYSGVQQQRIVDNILQQQ